MEEKNGQRCVDFEPPRVSCSSGCLLFHPFSLFLTFFHWFNIALCDVCNFLSFFYGVLCVYFVFFYLFRLVSRFTSFWRQIFFFCCLLLLPVSCFIKASVVSKVRLLMFFMMCNLQFNQCSLIVIQLMLYMLVFICVYCDYCCLLLPVSCYSRFCCLPSEVIYVIYGV